jgi:two-component system sensor histidine kinase KdpD
MANEVGPGRLRSWRTWLALGVAAVSLIGLTILLRAIHTHIGLASIFLIYLSVVVVASAIGGWWPGVLTAVVASQVVNWFFTPPLHRLEIADTENVVAVTVFVLVGAVTGAFVSRAAKADALEDLNDLRAALLNTVSHDLRTPLASIKASASSLRQPDVTWSPGDVKEFLATIEEETDRLDRLVANLLDMSRLQAGAVTLALAPVGLDEAVPLAIRATDAERDAFVVDVPETLPRVAADLGLLEHAVANLLDNAATWSKGEPVLVHARDVDGRVELRIVDHGPGVPPEDRELVFLPFRQLGDASGHAGVGLGMAVAKGLIEAMGGRIELEDTPGGGLTVVVSLGAAS